MKNHLSGYGISFLLHGSSVAVICILASLVPVQPPPPVIDLSILSGSNAAPVTAGESVPVQSQYREEKVPEKPLPEKVIEEASPVIPQILEQEPVTIAKTDSPPDFQIPEEKREEPDPVPLPREVVPGPMETVVEEPPPRMELQEREEHPVDTEKDKTTRTASTAVVTGNRKESGENAREQYLNTHFEYIKNNIQKMTDYPQIARKMGWEGRVILSFIVCEDGSIINIKIIESSGYALLDKNAVNAVKGSAPLPLPPVRAEIILPISYTLV